MKKISRTATVLALTAACSMPLFAQDSTSTTQQSASTSPNTTQPADTATMGAGPEDNNMARDDGDRDMGWIGLLGLLGLLGMRRRHHDHHDHHDHDIRRTTPVR